MEKHFPSIIHHPSPHGALLGCWVTLRCNEGMVPTGSKYPPPKSPFPRSEEQLSLNHYGKSQSPQTSLLTTTTTPPPLTWAKPTLIRRCLWGGFSFPFHLSWAVQRQVDRYVKWLAPDLDVILALGLLPKMMIMMGSGVLMDSATKHT